jgi:hypothetical protein
VSRRLRAPAGSLAAEFEAIGAPTTRLSAHAWDAPADPDTPLNSADIDQGQQGDDQTDGHWRRASRTDVANELRRLGVDRRH